MAFKTKRDSGTTFGFIFQGANNEGGVCDAVEYVWNYGGDVLDGDKAVVDPPEAAEGPSEYRSIVSDELTMRAVTTFKGKEF
jgi:multiple sugar transport system substrate-binding protein